MNRTSILQESISSFWSIPIRLFKMKTLKPICLWEELIDWETKSHRSVSKIFTSSSWVNLIRCSSQLQHQGYQVPGIVKIRRLTVSRLSLSNSKSLPKISRSLNWTKMKNSIASRSFSSPSWTLIKSLKTAKSTWSPLTSSICPNVLSFFPVPLLK